MSAWGDGVFENDQACDWLDQLVETGKPTAIDKALSFALKAKTGRLEADEASAALAAAEVVAAARGHRHADLPDDAKEWLATSGYVPTESSLALCIKTVERVRDDSELRELWAEGDELPAWKRGISGLLGRLAKPAKAAKPKKTVAAKSKVAPKPSPRTAVAALKKKRVFVVTQPGKPAPNWCCGIASKSDKSPLTDEDMQHFRQLEMLEELRLTGYKITDAGIQPLAAMTRLTMLELSKMPLTDASAAIFERLTGITSLNLEHTRVGDAVLEQVARMKELGELNLCRTAVTDAGIKHLQACTALTLINLERTRITDESLRTLSQLSAMTHFILGGTRVTSQGLPLLKPLPELRYLNFEDTTVDDDACATIAGFQNVDGLNLEGTQVTGEGLRRLTVLTKLGRLYLSHTSLTDDDVPTLLKFPAKATIFALKTKITAKGKRLIAEAGRETIYV
jgi:hypothetical protein